MQPQSYSSASSIHNNVVFINSVNPEFHRAIVTPRYIKKQAIYKQHRSAMLNNYLAYVQEYNKRVPILNKAVLEQQKQSETFVYQNKMHGQRANEEDLLKKEFPRVSIMEYNRLVDFRNAQLGYPLLEHKKYDKVQDNTRNYFANILLIYSLQLRDKNNILIKANATTVYPLRKVNIATSSIINLKRNGVFHTSACEKTIRNHVKRLAEAGVLFDYEFCGHQKPVKYHINPEILVIFDEETRKTLTTENQIFTLSEGKDLPHNNIDTSTILKEYKRKGAVDNSTSQDAETISQILSHNYSSTDETQVQIQVHSEPTKAFAGKLGGAAEKTDPISEKIRETVLPLYELATELEAGMHKTYVYSDHARQWMEHEVMYGNLTKEEFHEFMLQLMLKCAAPIWKSHNVVAGIWTNAYKNLKDTFLINPNGSIPTKKVQLYRFETFLKAINKAKRIFNHKKNTNVYRPFPAAYFDPTRKRKKELGFMYIYNNVLDRQAEQEKEQKRKAKRAAEATKRGKKLYAEELVEKKANQLKNGRISMEAFLNYINNNAHITPDVVEKVPYMIQKLYQC